MSRLSFSHTLLASFLLIAAILGATALGGLFALEDFAARHRASARDALGFSTAVQQLGERSVDMERSARQFLVLHDPVLRERFEQAREESLVALAHIAALQAPRITSLTEQWRGAATAAGEALFAGTNNEPATAALSRLPPLNEQLANEVRAQLDHQGQALLDEVDANRNRLAWHVLAAIVAACTLAALTGWWVLRPVNRVEEAIEALGESRFDQPVVIPGPADLRRVGRRLDWLRLRLADLEANRNRVLRHVSHELKTPLASLREGIALLEDGVVGGLTGEQQEVVSILEHNTRSLQARIEDLLGYNAAVFDARSLRRRPVSLRTLAEVVIAEQQLPIQTRNLKVVLRGDPPEFSADPDKLRIVLANLLANAVSFSPRDGEIRLTLRNLAGKVRIECIDQGPGAEVDEAERIFEPFFQGSRQPSVPRHGSGLGLSIVREFVVAHGGRVELLAAARGAHFRIELPNES
ncbi:sensor histidine kinase [Aromatoleum diolicum]|uniref:histidine kinase n=1 Tax=Aromatoleum diolicum TaxID=75796 RepID=A0ABX1QG98_9RHOO|nr:HAMP domain-containing sensor histidine kinase [Aromatoleum diolicum]NMG76527.1 HAMP domain-containing protein [Aromatoleum diolicum]